MFEGMLPDAKNCEQLLKELKEAVRRYVEAVRQIEQRHKRDAAQ
jgi:hypothetical protein